MSVVVDPMAAIALCALFIVRQLSSAYLLRAAPRKPLQRLGGRDVLVVLWVGYISLAFLALFDATHGGMTASRWIQFLALALGSGLRAGALTKIRPYYWPSIAFFADQRVVREGPYRFLAHPLYLGLAVESVALAALSGRLSAVLIASALVVAMQVQIRREEILLERRFGAIYRTYREGTFDLGDLFLRPWRQGHTGRAVMHLAGRKLPVVTTSRRDDGDALVPEPHQSTTRLVRSSSITTS